MATGHHRSAALDDEIARRMAQAGLRWTRARRRVIEVVAEADAPQSVPDLQDRIGREVPLSSLYRVINDLVEARIVIKVEFAQGFARFELDESLAAHHHHVVCTACGKVADIELSDVEAQLSITAKKLTAATGFTVDTHRLDFFGTCADCLQAS
jgi:Fe2+ or Zn2+ uptake regulation protein